MSEPPPGSRPDIREKLARFLSGQTPDRLFVHPTCHPTLSTGFCDCEGPFLRRLRFYLRAGIMNFIMRLPFSGLKIRLLRRAGARVGKDVYISADVWIDPMFPGLLTLEDNVFIGLGARIVLHEFRVDEFRAGKVIVRKGALIGGFAIVGCGVEIGEGATVAAGAVVKRNVPPGATAIGNPARIVRRPPGSTGPEEPPCANI